MPCILLVGKFPKPSENPFTTYYTAQGDFAKVLKEIFQKVFLTSYYGGRAGNAKDMQKKNAAICDVIIKIQPKIPCRYSLFPTGTYVP